MTNFHPLNDNVLVKLKTERERTASGIYIPDSAKSNQEKAEVIAIPPGSGEELAVGDIVMFTRTNAVEIKDQDDTYLAMPFTNIIGKFVEVDAI